MSMYPRKGSLAGFIVGVIVLVLAAAALALLNVRQAGAHMSPKGWQYPSDCCSEDGRECHPIDKTEVTIRPEGYIWRGRLFQHGDKAIKFSGDGDWHGCERRAWNAILGRVAASPYCIIVPEGGMG